MGVEIEHKYLVKPDWRSIIYMAGAISGNHVVQGYLSVDPERTVRVRINRMGGFICVKGKTTGCTRDEYEYQIPINDADSMIRTVSKHTVRKMRHSFNVHWGGVTSIWIIDEFLGDNQGLCIAELELLDAADKYYKPEWLDREVTGDPKYYNSNLAQKPYSTW